MARRQLPLPDGIAPARRAPPPLPTDDDDVPPPPVPSRPTPGRPAAGAPPSIPTSRMPPKPVMAKNVNHDNSEDDYSFDSDTSTESYEDMGQGGPPKREPPLPSRGYKEPKGPPVPPPARNKPAAPPEDFYDDGEGGDIYDEAEMGKAESEEEDEGETYDDMEVAAEEPLQEEYAECDIDIPSRSSKQEEEFVQESYDEFQGVAEDMYEVEEQQEEYQECEVGAAISEEVYQVADDDTPSAPPLPAAPTLPPPRPKQSREAAPPPRNVEKKTPAKPTGLGGMPAIAMGDIQSIKDRLKKVNVAKAPPPKAEPKTYTDHNELKSKFDFFKNKEKEALANKPGIAPKPSGLNLKKSSSVDKVTSPVNKVASPEKPLPSRNTSDSLPPVPSPTDEDLPPPPPSVTQNPSIQHRELPQIPTANGTPAPPPPRGKDGYTKVNVEEEVDDDDGDIYDDALSFEDPLQKEIWYFGEIDRITGNNKLKKLAMNGAYLLRKSSKGGNNQPYTLMVMYNSHIYNLKIRERNDGRMAIGEEKPDEMSFKSVVDLIKHHQSNDVILVHKDGKEEHTMLLRPPPK